MVPPLRDSHRGEDVEGGGVADGGRGGLLHVHGLRVGRGEPTGGTKRGDLMVLGSRPILARDPTTTQSTRNTLNPSAES